MPMNRKPNPTASLLTEPPRSVRPKTIKPRPPRPMNGMANASMLNLKPSAATSQLVNVVPRFEPKTTPKPFFKAMMPAPVNARTIKVTAELLCNTAVAIVPVSTARGVVLVYLRMETLKARPDRLRIDSSSKNMPNMKMPRPAKNSQKFGAITVLNYPEHQVAASSRHRAFHGNCARPSKPTKASKYPDPETDSQSRVRLVARSGMPKTA